MNGYGVVTVSKDESGRLTAAFQYDPLLVEKVKTIPGRKWHPIASRVIARSPDSIGTTKQSLRHKSSKTTEIYTHVNTKDFARIKNPLDQILEGKGG